MNGYFLNCAAARFYEEAFAAQPKLADDLGAAHRYNAACAAALAGCGQSKDAGKPGSVLSGRPFPEPVKRPGRFATQLRG